MKEHPGCGCLVMAFVVLGLIGSCAESREKREKAAEAEREAAERRRRRQVAERRSIRNEVQDFSVEHAPELHAAIQRLAREEEEMNRRLERLRKLLQGLGRKMPQDPEYQRWSGIRDEIVAARKRLEKERQDAFLLREKYLLSPNERSLREFRAALHSGENAARQYRDLYARILAAVSGVQRDDGKEAEE